MPNSPTLRNKLDAIDKQYKEQVFDVHEPHQRRLSDAEDMGMKRISGVFDRFAKTTAQKTWKWGDSFREWPIIDGFAPVQDQQTKLTISPSTTVASAMCRA